MTSHRVPPRHPDMPPIPQDGDGPVFAGGWLGSVSAGDRYPVIGARDAVAAAAARRDKVGTGQAVAGRVDSGNCPAEPGATAATPEPGAGSTASPSVVAPKSQSQYETDNPIPLTPAPASSQADPGALTRPAKTGVSGPGCRSVLVTLSDPHFGLAWRLSGDSALLVPAWLFRTDRGRGRLGFVAVHPNYLR